ncbi:protein kinase family protein, partial [Angustibacter aerolatus]
MLGRRVRVTVVAPGHPAAPAVLDAARRAAGVDDARLVRILDVGSEHELSYLVTEWLEGTDLAELLAAGPLAADDARTLTGEAALALEVARARGLHHLRLSPALLHRLDDGTVKVDGLAVAAALAEVPEPSADRASEADTRDLVAVLYACLTGSWPLDDDTADDLPPATRTAGGVVSPSEVVSGVPADLDTLCSQTFAGSGAPSTPAALAGQLAPWGRERRSSRPDGSFPHALPPVRLAPRPDPRPDPAP